jgi:facilitated trehalose transporter
MRDLMGKAYLKPLLTSLGLMFFQQFSGINAVIFYTVSIFEMSGSTVDSNISTIVVGLVNIGASIFATLLIDRMGRRVLLIISDILMIICLTSLGLFFYVKENHADSVDIAGLGWIPLVAFIVFVIGFSLG